MLRLLAAASAALLLALAATPASAEDEAGEIVTMEGSVEVGTGGAFAAAKVGTKVRSGDTVRTGSPGRARILFRDESVVNVGDGSVLVIDESVFDPDQGTVSTTLRLLQGKLRSLVSEYYGSQGASYQVTTPTSVSGVRGTEFVVLHDPGTETSEILGLGGAVAVHSVLDRKHRGVVIRAREITRVAKGQYPTPPRQIDVSDDTFQRLMNGLDFPGSGGPETMIEQDPTFDGESVEESERAPSPQPPAGETPDSAHPPDAPAHTGGDIVDQPIPVVDGPTDVEIEF